VAAGVALKMSMWVSSRSGIGRDGFKANRAAYSGRGKAQVKWLANNGRFGGAFVSRSSPHTVTRISCPQAAQWKMSMWVSSRAGMACDAASRIGLPQLQAGDSILSDEAIGFHLLLAPWGEIKGRE
jgi:hypothetical protein